MLVCVSQIDVGSVEKRRGGSGNDDETLPFPASQGRGDFTVPSQAKLISSAPGLIPNNPSADTPALPIAYSIRIACCELRDRIHTAQSRYLTFLSAFRHAAHKAPTKAAKTSLSPARPDYIASADAPRMLNNLPNHT
ncbi:hypothetical protein SNOG_06780 [Parastagonospora nodorum SN15]|uniref:Uncharacterized protein n=1 Tax=Phaeosphaeria nodorum (strain SN15 / ATCC MYA-4574 / FGSC 10173) TaxID=321614 RepID=Q0UN84_PHANO|nr:hypothetical protein SNOG_06780 [Parastagonospora nodorum SN15]EAT85431.1 hypothetical protein SNOG_06780 [Parastagonospora nodorum SN15]